MICTRHQILGGQINKDMDCACSTYEDERFIQSFGGKDLRERGHLEYLNVDGRIILK
jgi:hypothetical protein